MMPFSLYNAPSIFQNFVNDILYKFLNNFATTYLDDILIYSKNKKEYIEYVNKVLTALEKAGFLMDILKCEFHMKETCYFGLIISITGLKMDPEKVKVILGWIPPCCLKDLQRFIDFANFYRRFIKHFSKIAGPLTGLMKKDMHWTWTPITDTIFAKLKHAFTSAPVLVYFDPFQKTELEIDTSNWTSGNILSQYQSDSILRPIVYFSTKHSLIEYNYKIYDKELLVIIKNLEEWQPELTGTSDPFIVLTNHHNLQYFIITKYLSSHQIY